MMQQAQSGQMPLYLRPFMPPRTPSFDRTSATGMSPTRFSSIGLNTIRGQRVSTLIPKLKTLEPIQDISIHTALVRHLQFSPNGKYLATSRCVMISL
jgi:WD40 repeat protein